MQVYLDNAASTKLDISVLNEMLCFLTDEYANPSSQGAFAQKSAEAIEKARQIIADSVGAQSDEIFFNSGGTEANNTALYGLIKKGRNHIITTNVEHHSVLSVCDALKHKGCTVSLLEVDNSGRIDINRLESLIKPNTALISVMAANNETGNIYPLKEISAIAKKHGIVFHSDCVAAYGKIPICVLDGPDIITASAHKINGPKGAGFMFVKKGTDVSPLIVGGGQQNGFRAGTFDTAGIVGLGEAACLSFAALPSETERLMYLKGILTDRLFEENEGVLLNGEMKNSLPGILNVSFEQVSSTSLLLFCERNGLICSAGSACGGTNESHVIRALNKYKPGSVATLRLSMGKYNTPSDVEYAADTIRKALKRLRR